MQPIDTKARQAVVDELGEVRRQAALWTPAVNPFEAREAELEAKVLSWFENEPAEQPAIVEGSLYRLEVSARQNVRVLTPEGQQQAFKAMQKLKVLDAKNQAVKYDPFLSFKTTLGEIKARLGGAFLNKIAPQSRTGVRTFKVLPKSAPALSKAA